jgi:hypothetical protein
MRSISCSCVLALLLCSGADAATTTAGLGLGATAGFGAQANLSFHHFTRDLPLTLRISAAYSSRDAGVPLDARHVFINNNSNGTPTEDGHSWQLRLDLTHPFAHLGTAPVNLGFGVRKAFYTGTFDFVGGNENFDVTGRPWGVGLVLDTSLPIGNRVDFTLMAGADYYFDSRLEGHDTSYSPDNDNVNPHEDYQWQDADDAINQPSVEIVGLVGLRWRLGD